MLQHALHVQPFPVVTVLPCGTPLSQLLTNPGHLVAADLGAQAHLGISGFAGFSQFGLGLQGLAVQPAPPPAAMSSPQTDPLWTNHIRPVMTQWTPIRPVVDRPSGHPSDPLWTPTC